MAQQQRREGRADKGGGGPASPSPLAQSARPSATVRTLAYAHSGSRLPQLSPSPLRARPAPGADTSAAWESAAGDADASTDPVVRVLLLGNPRPLAATTGAAHSEHRADGASSASTSATRHASATADAEAESSAVVEEHGTPWHRAPAGHRAITPSLACRHHSPPVPGVGVVRAHAAARARATVHATASARADAALPDLSPAAGPGAPLPLVTSHVTGASVAALPTVGPTSEVVSAGGAVVAATSVASAQGSDASAPMASVESAALAGGGSRVVRELCLLRRVPFVVASLKRRGALIMLVECPVTR